MALVRPQCHTSVTKSGTDGSAGLAGIQWTKWHSTTEPDGPRLSFWFLLVKRQKTKQKRLSIKIKRRVEEKTQK